MLALPFSRSSDSENDLAVDHEVGGLVAEPGHGAIDGRC